MRVRKVTINPDTWSQVGEQQIFTNDIIDQAAEPDAKLTVGFARLGKGETLAAAFPYDEAVILTKGRFTVHTDQGQTVSARVGEVVYMPADSSNTFHADEDAEMVYVAHPPSVYAQWVRASASQ